MANDRDALTPTTSDEPAETVAYALRLERRKRVHQVDEIMAQITGRRLVEHPRQPGFVILKRPPSTAPSALARRSP